MYPVCMYYMYDFRHEAMTDLVALMSSLVDCKGKILVPGIYDTVQKLEEAEAKLYEPIDFDMVKFEDIIFNVPVIQLLSLFVH